MKAATESVLTDEKRVQFEENGYLKVPALVDRGTVAAVRKRIEEFWEGRHEYGWPNDHLRSFAPDDLDTPGGNFRTGALQKPSSLERVFYDLSFDEGVVAVMRELLGGAVRLYTDQTFFKPGNYPAIQSFYHQDAFYWRLKPGRCINCWIPLDPVGPKAISLAFMPGTHKSWRVAGYEDYWDAVPQVSGKTDRTFKRKRIPLDSFDASQEDLTSGEPGDAFFFTNYTWHRADPNESGVTKVAYGVAFQLDRDDNALSPAEFEEISDRLRR